MTRWNYLHGSRSLLTVKWLCLFHHCRDADRVVVLDAGKVVENGEPAALLAKEEVSPHFMFPSFVIIKNAGPWLFLAHSRPPWGLA